MIERQNNPEAHGVGVAALAAEMRQRQIHLGQVPRWMVERLSDDEMIDCYVTCSGCGHRPAQATIDAAILSARDADDFLGRVAHAH